MKKFDIGANFAEIFKDSTNPFSLPMARIGANKPVQEFLEKISSCMCLFLKVIATCEIL